MLDLRTMVAMLVLTTFLAGIGVLCMPVAQERRAAVARWGLANLIMALSWCLMALRGQIPLWPSLVLSNTGLFLAMLLQYQALGRLLGYTTRDRQHWLAVAAFFTGIVLLLELNATFNQRLLLVSFGIGTVIAMTLYRLWQNRNPHLRSMRIMLLLCYGIAGATALARGLYAATHLHEPTQLFTVSLPQLLLYLGYYFSVVGNGTAFLLLLSGLAYEDLLEQSNHDVLTGVRNRRSFMEAAEHDMAQAERHGLSYALLMLDLDHFKRINDQHGHRAGDAALQLFGQILQNSVRQVDLVGRYGGEEFCVLLVGASLEEAQESAERIRQLTQVSPVWIDGQLIHITVSVGIAGATAGHYRTLPALLEAADQALYEAKRDGRNRCAIALRDLWPATLAARTAKA